MLYLGIGRAQVNKCSSVLICLFLAILSSCNSHRSWETDEMGNGDPSFSSSRWLASGIVPPMELEWRTVEGETQFYLNLLTFALDKSPQCPIRIEDNETGYSLLAYVCEGGQRLILPTEASPWLVALTHSEDPLTIAVGNRQATFS